MTIPRVLIKKLIKKDDVLQLTDNEYHYIIRVRRLSVNDTFFAVDETGREFIGRILKIGKKSFTAKFNFIKSVEDKNYRVNLYFGLLKGEKNDFIVNIATQLGVSKITPVIMERTIISLEHERAMKKRERFIKIAKEAVRASYLSEIPVIEEINRIENLNFEVDDLKILFSERVGLKGLKDFSQKIIESNNISVFFGPEGGITDKEHKFLVEKGFIPVSLGERVLKAEIAILYALSVVRFLKKGKL